MADPTDAETIKAVRLACGKQVVPWIAVPSELVAAVEQLYGVNYANATSASLRRPTAAREDLKRLTDFASNEPLWLATNRRMIRNPGIANFLDRCGLSIPCHERGGAPVGFSLMGETLGDRRLLAIGLAVEAILA